MKMIYSKQMDSEIYAHEKKMLDIYAQKIQEHSRCFEDRGYELKYGLIWKMALSESTFMSRLDFQNKYECYVYCAVQKNGRDICVNSNNGEADYYSLSTAWMVSSIRKRWGKLEVELFLDIDDVNTEIEEFLRQCDSQAEIITQ